MKKKDTSVKLNILLIVCIIFALFSVVGLGIVLLSVKMSESVPTDPPAATEAPVHAIMDAFDYLISEPISQTQEILRNAKRVFWISENAQIAPKPNEACYGEATDPSTLQWLLDDAAELLDGQETVFSTDIEIYPGSTITYYLDESIFVVTWQELLDKYCYTFSEVKIMHPSQFRRHLANNEYDSDYIHPVSRMAGMTNAVLATSADFYLGRNHGIIVYQGEVKRTEHADLVDTCFIDEYGNMILTHAGEILGDEAAQAFVDANNIDFSLAFGPILIKDGQRCDPATYYLGEVNKNYPRAALCQKDDLHYVFVAANAKGSNKNSPTIRKFTDNIEKLNCKQVYTLDGGRTATISMNGKAKNPLRESERWISDIIYFATAIPSAEPLPDVTQ